MAKFTEIAVKSFPEETGGIAMTLYESAKREGGLEERKRVLQSIVHNMLQRGVDYETIASYTDLSVEEVQLLGKKAS